MDLIMHSVFEAGYAFLSSRKLPLHRYGQYHSSILNGEDFSDAIKLHLQSVSQKDGHFTAQTLVDFFATKEIQDMLEQADIQKRSISVCVESAQDSNVKQEKLTAVAAESFFVSLILLTRSQLLKNLWRDEVTFVTFIPSTTVS
jgi:hypothetical protein